MMMTLVAPSGSWMVGGWQGPGPGLLGWAGIAVMREVARSGRFSSIVRRGEEEQESTSTPEHTRSQWHHPRWQKPEKSADRGISRKEAMMAMRSNRRPSVPGKGGASRPGWAHRDDEQFSTSRHVRWGVHAASAVMESGAVVLSAAAASDAPKDV